MLNSKNKIHTFLVCALAIAVWIMVLSNDKTSSPPSASAQETLSSNISFDASPAIEAIKSEKKVVDMHYDPDAIVQWNIGVLNDGSKQHGFEFYRDSN